MTQHSCKGTEMRDSTAPYSRHFRAYSRILTHHAPCASEVIGSPPVKNSRVSI